jgi:hypothetical protein
VAEQGYLAPLDHGAGSSCRSLYALALMVPPKFSSHTLQTLTCEAGGSDGSACGCSAGSCEMYSHSRSTAVSWFSQSTAARTCEQQQTTTR